ncbi:MAG: methyltransferase domain-containing protein [Pyrinomonadaceae bacterium]|nr:methyltransferase domain-containing protein [Pyrinomonadaceae bacterium]
MAIFERLRQEFNEWARAGRGAKMERGHRPTGEQAIKWMRVGPEAHVLDVGCGSGWAARMFADLATDGHVVGVDVSDEMIREAREQSADYANINYRVARADDLPFAAETFSHAFSMETLYYSPDIGAALREIKRVLRTRVGLFVAVVDLYRENESSHQWVEQLNVPVKLLSAAEYRELFVGAGFVEVQETRLLDPSPIPKVYEGTTFKTHADYVRFREAGSLMISGRVEE